MDCTAYHIGQTSGFKPITHCLGASWDLFFFFSPSNGTNAPLTQWPPQFLLIKATLRAQSMQTRTAKSINETRSQKSAFVLALIKWSLFLDVALFASLRLPRQHIRLEPLNGLA